MDANSILTIMQMTQPLATLAHAEAMAEYGRARGLTPFAEFYPIFAEKKEERGKTWVVIGLKGLTFKEHYAVQGRWSQKSGGYSTPVHTSEDATEINSYNKKIPGIRVTVGIITNRDYAALAQMALARIPGWDYKTEREAFIHYGEAFVANSHRPPSGWTVEGVARKRATEQALKLAFGKEPTQAGNIYAVSMDEQRPRLEDARGLLYPERKSRPALAIVDAEPITPAAAEEQPAEWSDEAEARMIEELQAEADAGESGTPATTRDTLADDERDFPRPHWTSKAAAIAWAIAQGAFGEPDSGTAPHARNAFDKVKAEHNPADFAVMSDLWYTDVLRRISEKAPV